VTNNGLSGCIEIRNGKPAISLGLSEHELPIHIESDIVEGIHIHTDDINPRSCRYFSNSHGIHFTTQFYKVGDSTWITEARSAIDNKLFEDYTFDHGLSVSDSNGWEVEDGYWKKICYFDDTEAVATVKGYVEVNFANDSTIILSTSDGFVMSSQD